MADHLELAQQIRDDTYDSEVRALAQAYIDLAAERDKWRGNTTAARAHAEEWKQEWEGAEAKLDAVRKLHAPVESQSGFKRCVVCGGGPWPCPTIRVVGE